MTFHLESKWQRVDYCVDWNVSLVIWDDDKFWAFTQAMAWSVYAVIWRCLFWSKHLCACAFARRTAAAGSSTADTRLLQLHCIDVMKSMPIRIQLTWQVLLMSAQSAQMSQRVFIAGDGRRCDGSCLRHHKKYHLTDGDSKSSRTIHEGHSTPTKSNQRRKLINGGMSSTWSVALNDDINTKIQ